MKDTMGREKAKVYRGFECARHKGSRLGNTKVERIVRALRKAAVGFNGGQRRGRFQRDFDLMEVQFFTPADVLQRLGDHTLGQLLTLLAACLSRVAAL